MRRVVKSLSIILLSGSLIPLVCTADSPASPVVARLMNDNPQCVGYANEILVEHKSASDDTIKALIKCLPGERFHFDNGAARASLVAIGESAVPALVRTLDDKDFNASEGAALALGAMGSKARSAAPALKAILRKKGLPYMLPPDAAQALGKIGEIQWLIAVANGSESGIPVYLGVEGLGAAGPAGAPAVPLLISMLNGADGVAQMQAAEALGKIGPAANAAVPRLAELSRSPLNFVQSAAGEALQKIGTAEALAAGLSYQRRKNRRDSFYQSMAVFVGHPLMALLVAIGFGLLWKGVIFPMPNKRVWTWPLIVPSILWALYAVWEFYCTLHRANIRIDLLVLYPLLAISSVLALALWMGSFLWAKDRS